MKIKYDRDFMEEIDYANNGVCLKKCLDIGRFTGTGAFIGFPSLIGITNLSSGTTNLSELTQNIPNILILSGLFFGVPGFMLGTSIEFFAQYHWKNKNKIDSEENLSKLSIALKRLNVNTNVELLKKSKLIRTRYKIKVNDKKIPVLKRERDISIIVKNNMGKEFEETLLEEHIVGNCWKDNYELSVKEPDKALKLVKQKANA